MDGSAGPAPERLEEDRALLDGFRRGDKAALARVFRAYADQIALVLRAGVKVSVDGQAVRVGQHLAEHEIEVLVQDTFLRAFSPKARESYDGVRPFGGWLATIARNLLIDRARRKRRESRVVALDDFDAVEAPSLDPTWRIEEQALERLLSDFKRTLGEPEQSIYRMRYEERRTHRETAKALGLTDIVVRRRDTKLRARILELLRAQGFLSHAEVTIGASLLPRKDR